MVKYAILPGGHLLSGRLDVVQHLGGRRDRILDQLFRILGSDRVNALRDRGPKAGGDLPHQHFACFWTHWFVSCGCRQPQETEACRLRHAATSGFGGAAWRGVECTRKHRWRPARGRR